MESMMIYVEIIYADEESSKEYKIKLETILKSRMGKKMSLKREHLASRRSIQKGFLFYLLTRLSLTE